MPTYNIGPCGCCGSPCPVSWRFAPLNFEFQYFQLGSSWQTSLYTRTPSPAIEVTWSDGTTETFSVDPHFPSSYAYRATATDGYVTITKGSTSCRAEWSGEWTIPIDEYAYLATESNGTITYGAFEPL